MIEVVSPGPLATVQDHGRPGFAHIGVPTSGALDMPALDRANAIVGNATGAAGLECTLGGLIVLFHATTTFALSGAPTRAKLGEAPIEHETPHTALPGDLLRVGTTASGLRTYVAFAGGIDVPEVFGSRSTDTLGGIGPPPLTAGQRIAIGAPTPRGTDWPRFPRSSGTTAEEQGSTIRLTLGPRDDWFTPEALRLLCSEPFTVNPASSRVGLRLNGPQLAYARDDELRSEGLVVGSIQVPPNGQPIVMLADHPTTGGYPVIGVACEDDLPVAAQARPGSQISFALL